MNAAQKKGEKVHLMTGKTGNFSTSRGGIMIICGDVVSQLFYFCIAVIPHNWWLLFIPSFEHFGVSFVCKISV